MFVSMVTSSMSSANESTGNTLRGRDGGLASSSDKCMEGGVGAAEGKGRGKETTPSTEDSVIASLTTPQIGGFLLLPGTIIVGRGSAVGLLGQ